MADKKEAPSGTKYATCSKPGCNCLVVVGEKYKGAAFCSEHLPDVKLNPMPTGRMKFEPPEVYIPDGKE